MKMCQLIVPALVMLLQCTTLTYAGQLRGWAPCMPSGKQVNAFEKCCGKIPNAIMWKDILCSSGEEEEEESAKSEQMEAKQVSETETEPETELEPETKEDLHGGSTSNDLDEIPTDMEANMPDGGLHDTNTLSYIPAEKNDDENTPPPPTDVGTLWTNQEQMKQVRERKGHFYAFHGTALGNLHYFGYGLSLRYPRIPSEMGLGLYLTYSKNVAAGYANNANTSPGIVFSIKTEGSIDKCLSFDEWFCQNVNEKAKPFQRNKLKLESWCGYSKKWCKDPNAMRGGVNTLDNTEKWTSLSTLVRPKAKDEGNGECNDQHFDRSPHSLTFGSTSAPCMHKSFESQIKINPAAKSFEDAGIHLKEDGSPTGSFTSNKFRGNPVIDKIFLSYPGHWPLQDINTLKLPGTDDKFSPSKYGSKQWKDLPADKWSTLENDLKEYTSQH